MGNAVPGQPATEDVFNATRHNPRVVSELAGASLSDAGVNVSVVYGSMPAEAYRAASTNPELLRKLKESGDNRCAPGQRRSNAGQTAA